MRRFAFAAALACAVLFARPAAAYSVLAHEALIDAEWDGAISRVLLHRFPHATPDDLLNARAYAYGGSVIQDLGYYPFGSHLFTNLVHYIRSGDFVEALFREARDLDEYAFAIGALAHYAADIEGHPTAVNRAVALVYPKDRARFGDEVTYAEDPKRHLMMEFAFDVVQVANGAYRSKSYHDFVGFHVAKPVLERAFRDTYALEMKDLFPNVDLAIGTYRYAIGSMIPEMTRVAWRDKQKEIAKATPGITRAAFIYTFARGSFEQEYGTTYERPGRLARFLGFLFRILPKVGPLRALAFHPPTPEAERLFLESFTQAKQRFRRALEAIGPSDRLRLANADFDTGRPSAAGEYPLADRTYGDLLEKLASRQFVGTTPALRTAVLGFYRRGTLTRPCSDKERKRQVQVRQWIAALSKPS